MYSYQFFNQTYIWSTPYLVQFYLKKNKLNSFSLNSQPIQTILNTKE